MFCNECGAKAADGAKFCTNCGQVLLVKAAEAVPDKVSASGTHCLAVHLKTGMIKREPWAMWIGPQRCAMICIGQKNYDAIVSGQPNERAREQAFRSYAEERLARDSLDNVLRSHPKSVAFDTSQIRQLQIIATYDSEMDRYNEYERFILDLPKTKYRGAFERDTSLRALIETLKSLLGGRYSYKTMEQFPFL